ncbi:hypothetical protein Drorol1_Dr00013618 [Drosera rotundifolia]
MKRPRVKQHTIDHKQIRPNYNHIKIRFDILGARRADLEAERLERENGSRRRRMRGWKCCREAYGEAARDSPCSSSSIAYPSNHTTDHNMKRPRVKQHTIDHKQIRPNYNHIKIRFDILGARRADLEAERLERENGSRRRRMRGWKCCRIGEIKSTHFGCGIGNLLVAIDHIDVRGVVVDAYVVVGIVGVNCDLEYRGEDVGGGQVEGENRRVLEGELGFLGLQDGPGDKEDEEDDEADDEEAHEEAA